MSSRTALASPAAPPPGLPLRPGDPTTIGPYRLVRRLGSGGMGTVFLATLGHGPLVALKILRPELADDAEFLARFHHEIAVARRVAGWCTARVLAADVEAATPYFVTEYIEGPPLDRVVTETGPLPSPTLEGFATGVAAALTAIHGAGLVHRDLKPANVLLAPSGPRVIDFGIARALDHSARLTATGLVLGTPGWMAPEQLTGRSCGTPLDVFLWGGLVLYAGTGRKPFGEGALDVVSARILHAEPDRAGLPPALAELVGAALAKDPEARPTAHEVLRDLLDHPADAEQALTRKLARTWVMPGMGADPGGWEPPVQRRARGASATRRLWPVLLVAILALGLAGWRLRMPADEVAPPSAAAASPGTTPETAPVTADPPAADPPAADPPAAADSPAGQSAEQEDAVAVEGAIGAPVRDGPVEFTVTRIQCGLDEFTAWRSLKRRATRGQYCLADVEVMNVGDLPHDLSGITQFAYDQAGEAVRMDGASHAISAEGGLFEKLAPGARATGTLAFLLPEGQQASMLELHGSTSGSGVRVRLGA